MWLLARLRMHFNACVAMSLACLFVNACNCFSTVVASIDCKPPYGGLQSGCSIVIKLAYRSAE